MPRNARASQRRDVGSRRHPGPVRTWLGGLIVAGATTLLVPAPLGWAVRLAAGWDAAMVIVLGLLWVLILSSDAAATRRRAAAEDPGRVGVFVVALLTGLAGLIAATVLLRRPEDFTAPEHVGTLIGLGVLAVVAAWTMIHTAFTLHYAHLYYRDQGQPGGLTFAGGPPDDRDFAYYSFTIGMTFQTADITITNQELRRATLGHALLAFLFNTTILALAVNLLFGRLP